MILVEGAGPAKHGNNRWFITPLYFTGPSPAYALARNYRRFRSIIIFHDTHVCLYVLLEVSRLQFKIVRH